MTGRIAAILFSHMFQKRSEKAVPLCLVSVWHLIQMENPDGNEAEGAAVLFSSLPAQQQDQTGKQARLGAHVPSDDNHTFSS
jgi:hypothetical protein